MKIVVYAICKNEEKFVKRWVKSMSEADQIYVLDTGSTDNSINELKKLNVNVHQTIIQPWRFDKARNLALELVPKDIDICVCTDLDEVFSKGWRNKLEQIWKENTTRLRYNYNWSFNENNKPSISFYIDKIHLRQGYRWIHPVHEILKYKNDKENFITSNEITLNHYADKKKSRSYYLNLLELSVKETPSDDRNMHYLGREYLYNKQYNNCIKTLKKHLRLKNATWKDERSASMRFISRAYINLNNSKMATMWLKKAIKETPYLRDPYVEMAILNYTQGKFNKVIKNCLQALAINYQEKTYINEFFSWDHTIFDLLSIAYFNKNKLLESLFFANEAVKIVSNKKNKDRINDNINIIKNTINSLHKARIIS